MVIDKEKELKEYLSDNTVNRKKFTKKFKYYIYKENRTEYEKLEKTKKNNIDNLISYIEKNNIDVKKYKYEEIKEKYSKHLERLKKKEEQKKKRKILNKQILNSESIKENSEMIF